MALFDLSRWFAGIGGASEAPSSLPASPQLAARVHAAVDGLPVTLFEFDANGIYTCAAGKYLGLFGITSAQIVGRSVFDFPKFVPGKNMMVRRALAGEAVSFTGIWPRGRFKIGLEPRFGEDGRVAAVVGLGIELGKAEKSDAQFERLLEALRQSEARFRAMCDGAPLGIYVTNRQLELGYVNPALCSLLGRGPNELLGRPWQTLLHPDEREHFPGGPEAGPRASASYAAVLRMARPDGSLVWTSLRMAEMRDEGEVLGYVGAVADITGERTATLAADRAQRDLRRVIESSPEGIAVVRDGRFSFVNRALLEALGEQQPADLLGQEVATVVHPDDRARALELIAQPAAAAADGSVHELRCRKLDGEYALMEMTSSALAEFDGAPALLLTARDITQKKRLQAQLLVTERLLSVGTLAAGVAHEVNNPLAAVLSNLDWVTAQLARLEGRLDQPDPESARVLRSELQRMGGVLGEAREAAGRVRGIVGDLKLFSRSEEELRGPVELNRVLDSAARMAWNEVRHRARMVRDYPNLPLVHGSEARLGQVFLNLIINAAHAIPEGDAGAHEISLSAREQGAGHVVVEVADTGCGIPAAIRGRIFDPFFTTKPPGIGTGLGLAICHRIVTSLGGRIEVESQPGRGSTFRVTLVAAPPAARPTAPSQPPPPLAELRGRVLVIDDDASMGNAIKLVLSEEHEVDVFLSARQALERLRGGQRYDAIVCDVMMPEMSGMDFHSELAGSRPETAAQIIFLTGGAFTLRAREFLDRIPNPRLDKPFDSDSLRALVNRQVTRAS